MKIKKLIAIDMDGTLLLEDNDTLGEYSAKVLSYLNKNGYMVVLIAFAYLLARVIGKWFGAYSGASITKCEKNVKKYLGFALVPQAGVAIGLATSASQTLGAVPEFAEAGALLLAIVLTSTLVYELIGPVAAKFALQKAGEIPLENV